MKIEKAKAKAKAKAKGKVAAKVARKCRPASAGGATEKGVSNET